MDGGIFSYKIFLGTFLFFGSKNTLPYHKIVRLPISPNLKQIQMSEVSDDVPMLQNTRVGLMPPFVK